mmetsp:Transcript_36948/g.66458  ORF Transcript_36948/g.66458 Transcript_36948/m.66458 type:complete len:257 (-) Transcript_36948:74-844(-)
MPSRKRNKGKARKAKASEIPTKDDDQQQGQQERRGQERQEKNQQLLHCLINSLSLEGAENKCDHGSPPPPIGDICCRFLRAFENNLNVAFDDSRDAQEACVKALYTVLDGQEVCHTYRMKIADSLVTLGTDYLLKGQVRYTNMATSVAIAVIGMDYDDLKRADTHAMLRDLVQGGERETTRFFSKRIDCSCLKEKYKQVKHQPKLGMCSHCEQTKERRKFLVCTGCRNCQYCSKECQQADWPKHKDICPKYGRSQT